MNVVVVESPAKAKTINKYLGLGYEVLASFGHVRDLPPKNGSVDPDQDFHMLWEVDPKAQKRLNDIAQALKGASKLILATDPDREGEAISWHVLEVLKEKKALKDQEVERVVFNAITKQSVTEAMANPRHIDHALVDAYLARRALDYLVGFTLSPVLWRKLPGARSAGRVQSVALRLVCDRELEIEKFVAREFWSLVATLATPRGDTFEARLVGADGQKIQRLDIGSGAEAEAFKQALETATFTVATVEAKPTKRNPYPPFTTSTLQQEASRKLGFAPAHTMRIAQRLYEGVDIGGETVGLITYMRTDGVQIAEDALPAIPRSSALTTASATCRKPHDVIRPRPRTRRKRTRLFARPTSRVGRATSPAISSPSRPSFMSSSGCARSRARWSPPISNGPPPISRPRSAPACSTCGRPDRWSSSMDFCGSITKIATIQTKTTSPAVCLR
jgi:DNA topoisomerase-1